MKILLKMIISGLIVCFSAGSALAISITGTSAPQINSITVNGTDAGPLAVNALQTLIDTAFASAYADAETELAKFGNQPDLAKGFANANASAAQAATLQGFQDYSLFAITTGIMTGFQLPSFNPDYYNDIDQKVKDKGDIYAGAGAGLAIINAGMNTGFIYPGLYLNAKFGYLSIDNITDNLSVKSTLIGIGANYTWLQSRSLLSIVKWRGVSFGTGFLYNRNEVKLKIEPDSIESDSFSFNYTGVPDFTGRVVIDPTMVLGFESSTYTIPFDVTTSVCLLWFLNFNLGAGIDFNFGSTDIIINPKGAVNFVSDADSNVNIDSTPGRFDIDGGTSGKSPSLVRARITTGLGFNIWAVKIDFPVIIYPFDSAFAAGVTAGIVW